MCWWFFDAFDFSPFVNTVCRIKNVALFLVALVVGWFLGASFGVSEVREHGEKVAVSVVAAPNGTLERISDLEASLAETEAALELAQSELETVRTAARRSAAEVSEEEAEPAQSPFMANVQSIAAESSKRRKQEKFERLKLSLNLTPEQQAVYEEKKEQESLERQEATAYRELSSLQQQFLLDEGQKDQVFKIFYDKDYAVKHSEWERLGIDPSGTDGYMDSKVIEHERLLEALSEVLAEDQLELYRKKLDADFEMQRKSMQMFSGGLSSKVKEE
jgi:hypothetical protein